MSKMKFLQERKRLSRFIFDSDFEDGDFNCQFKKLYKNSIYLTVAPIEFRSLYVSLNSRKINSPVISILDGVYDFSNAIKNDKHSSPLHMPSINLNILCMGNHERDILRILNPRANINSYRPKFLHENIRDMALVYKYDFLITTANTCYFDNDEFDLFIDLLDVIIDNLNDLGFSFKFRIFDCRILNYLKEKWGDFENDIDNSFSDVIKSVASVITTPSTVSVEAMLLDKPVATMYYRDEPLLTQTGWIVHKSVNFSQVFKSMKSRENIRMKIQRALLKNYIDVDIDKLDKFTIDSLKDDFNVNDAIELEAGSLLLSKFNFNLKFFIKMMLHYILKLKNWSFK